MQPTLDLKRPVAPHVPAQPSTAPWIILAVLAVILLAVGTWFLVDYLTPTDGEAMLRDYVSAWEEGDLASLSGHFALGGTLFNATTARSFDPEDIQTEMTRIVGAGTVDVTGLAVGSSDRIATARFEVVSPTGETLDGVSVWEMVGGAIQRQTVSYVTVYETAG